jgi:DnaJ-domain-containing protein 1
MMILNTTHGGIPLPGIVCLLLPLLFILFYIFRYRFWQKFLDKGRMPPFYPMREDHLIQVYVSAAGLVMQQGVRESHQKTNYVYKFAIHKLTTGIPPLSLNSYYIEIKEALQHAIKHPMQVTSMCNWLLKHDCTRYKKVQLLTFLARLAFIDGQIHPEEIQVIHAIGRGLLVGDAEIQAIIQPFREIQEARAREAQEAHARSRQHTTLHTQIRLDKYYELLKIPVGAELAEIKRAYRKLAMQFHPDRMFHADKTAFEAAQDQFIAIQQAYEVLCEIREK